MSLFRLLPGTIKGRLLLSSTATLFLIQIIIICVFFWDMHERWTETGLKFSAIKIINTARILNNTPPELRKSLLRGQNGRSSFFLITDKPLETAVRNRSMESKIESSLALDAGAVNMMTDDAPDYYADDFPVPNDGEIFVDDRRGSGNRFFGIFASRRAKAETAAAPEVMMYERAAEEPADAMVSAQSLKKSFIRYEDHSSLMTMDEMADKVMIPASYLESHVPSSHGTVLLNDGKYLAFAYFRPDVIIPTVTPRVFYTIVFASLFGAFLLFFLVRGFTQPLHTLTKQVNRLSHDYESKPLPVTGPEEIKDLLESFNRMQERITTFIQDRTRILAAISHDLKTPLTSIVLRAEMLPDCEDKNKLIDTVSNMSKMVRATLDFARSEENREECRELRLSSLVESIASDYQDNGHDVSFTEESAFKNANTFLCRPTEMHRILQNLIDNSLCYGTQVKVRLQENSDAIRLMVEDNGPGIPEDQQENVFKPFMRLDKARATDDAHVGLGLSIVRNLVLKQGGSIDIENIKPHGLRIAITYPLN